MRHYHFDGSGNEWAAEHPELTVEELSDTLYLLKEVVAPILHHDFGDHDLAVLQSYDKLREHENPSRLAMRLVELMAMIMLTGSMMNGDTHICDYLHQVIDNYENALAKLN